MALRSNLKAAVNKLLVLANLKLDTLTAARAEAQRIRRQLDNGWFEAPSFPMLEGMRSFDGKSLIRTYSDVREDVDRLIKGEGSAHFDASNSFYRSPDAEILYCMVRWLAPKRIVEIGSGNSTRVIRQAISDSRLNVKHLAIDPEPRADITGVVDRIIRARFEEADVMAEIMALEPNDILFIDSSHQVHVANDVAKLFCNAIPALTKGVAVHVHDIFLPYDYPEPFCTEYSGWGEQYLLQVMLASHPREILWPGYYIQQMRRDLRDGLPFLSNGRAQSFWFRA